MKVTGGYRAHRSLLVGDASFPSDGETQTSLPIFPGRSLWISVVSRVNKKDPSFGRKAEARRSGDYRNSDSCFGAKDGTLPLARCSLSSTWRFALHHSRDSLAARFIPTSFTRSRGMCCIGLATSQINGVVDEWGMARLSAPLLYRSERKLSGINRRLVQSPA